MHFKAKDLRIWKQPQHLILAQNLRVLWPPDSVFLSYLDQYSQTYMPPTQGCDIFAPDQTKLNFVTHLWTIPSQLRQLQSPQPIRWVHSCFRCFEWPIRDRNQPTRGCHLHLVPLTFKLAYPLRRLSLLQTPFFGTHCDKIGSLRFCGVSFRDIIFDNLIVQLSPDWNR